MPQCFRQPATKTLITINQNETFKSIWSSALLRKPRFHVFVFLSNLFPLRDLATLVLPQQLRLESSTSLDLSISLIPRSQSTPTSVASAQIHSLTVSLPPSCSSARPCMEMGLPQYVLKSPSLPKHASQCRGCSS